MLLLSVLNQKTAVCEKKINKWQDLITSKKKFSNPSDSLRDNYLDQNVINEHDESRNGNVRQNNPNDNQQARWGDMINRMRRKTVNKSPDIEEGLGEKMKIFRNTS